MPTVYQIYKVSGLYKFYIVKHKQNIMLQKKYCIHAYAFSIIGQFRHCSDILLILPNLMFNIQGKKFYN